MIQRGFVMFSFEPSFPEHVIPDDCNGMRLDRFLTRMWPGMGRRGARRVLDACRVDVDGRARAAGFRVSVGQRVRVRGQEFDLAGEDATATFHGPETLAVRVAGRNSDFAALVKPAGVHCERLPERLPGGLCQGLSGRPRGKLTLEEALPVLFPEAPAILLNRLDLSVSGLVLAALHQRAAQDYAVWQDQGRVRKEYLAVVHGRLNRVVVIRADLDTAKRRKVRALSVDEPDALRWTRVTPLVATKAECLEISEAWGRSARLERDVASKVPWDAAWERTGEITAVRVEIFKGRRHQIRAHLASIGHPVVFDPLYGSGPDLGWIGLHHRKTFLPGFQADSGKEFKLLRE